MDRSHVKDILPDRLEQYIVESENDLTLNETNLRDKAMLRGSLGAKWSRYLFEEEYYKKKLIDAENTLLTKLSENVFISQKQKLGNTSNIKLNEKIHKMEIQEIAKQDPTYIKLIKMINEQDDIIRCINEIRKLIGTFNYDISNCKEIEKLERI